MTEDRSTLEWFESNEMPCSHVAAGHSIERWLPRLDDVRAALIG